MADVEWRRDMRLSATDGLSSTQIHSLPQRYRLIYGFLELLANPLGAKQKVCSWKLKQDGLQQFCRVEDLRGSVQLPLGRYGVADEDWTGLRAAYHSPHGSG